jgi:Peptidase family M28
MAPADHPARPWPSSRHKILRVIYTPGSKTRLSVAVVSLLTLPACALTTGNRSNAPASAITEDDVRSHMAFLASDALNGRGSGTRDELIAVSYAAALMQQWGLQPAGTDGSYIQQVEMETNGETKRQTWNAVGRLPGSDAASASQVILISAHIDHLGNRPPREGTTTKDTIYNGADDDASGSVAVLTLAKALAIGPRPKRTIVFALFGSEEFGGVGSRYYADHPTVPLTQIVANLQFEMIGRPDSAVAPRTLWLTGYERSTLGPALAKQGARLVQDPHPQMRFFVRSDNITFARRGVVAHTVSSYGLHKDYHQPSDELRGIDFVHMTDAIRSLLEPIRWLANSGFKPEWLPGGKP